MMHFLGKRWFLLLLLAGLALAFLRVPGLRRATDLFDPRVVVGAALFLMACSLDSRQLLSALTHPWPALWAVLVSYVLLPLVALAAGRLFDLADYRVGLLLIASVPCTLASAVLWTRMAGGNEAIALLVVVLTTATSWLITTAWLAVGLGAETTLDAADMMRGLLFVLVLPVSLGQLVRGLPALVRVTIRWKIFIGVLARLLIFSIILKAAVGVSDQLHERTETLALGAFMAVVGLCIALHVAALFFGFGTGRLLRFDRASCIALAIAGSQKTLPVGLFLFETYFKDTYPLAVVPVICFHIGQLVIDTLIAERLAHRSHAFDAL
jgi:solute carrier family 10 (sodium/bile acid cotransporter), member 7